MRNKKWRNSCIWLNKNGNLEIFGYKFMDEIFRDNINQPKNVEGWIKLKKIR